MFNIPKISLIVSAGFAAMLLAASSARAQVVILDDFGSNRLLTFTNAANATSTVSGGDLNLTTTSSASFIQFIRATGAIPRSGTTFNLLDTGDTLQLALKWLDAGVTQNFTARLAVSTNAWTDGGATYRGFNTATVSGTGDGSSTINFGLQASSAFQNALANWGAGNGTFFEIYVDNSGFPALATSQQFALDSVVVVVPEPGGVWYLGGAGLLLALRRRRR